jgi:hypothetical protein
VPVVAEFLPDEVFVIRFWAEPDGEGAAPHHWRARIRVLSSGRELHADGVEQAIVLIRSVLRKAAAEGA